MMGLAEAVPTVAVTGWSWTTVFVALLNVLVGGALVAWIKQRPQMREIEKSANDKLVDDLMTRITKIEAAMESQRTTYEQRIETERRLHDAEIRMMRHRMANLDQSLTMLLMLIEQDPERAREAAKRVREMRATQEARESAERAAMVGSLVANTEGNTNG